MGQCTSAPHGRSPSHRHSKHPREPSYDELDAQITRLEQEKADVKEKYGKLRQEVRNRRAELDQERQETTRLDEENGQLQLALKNLENIRSQLETTNHKLYEEAAEKERKWRVQDEQLRMYYDGEIDALKRRNWEDQANWNKEKEQLVSSYEKDKEARISEYRSQQEIWRILEQDLRSGHKEEKNKLSAAHQTEMDCKDKKHAGEIEELKKQHAEENRRLKTQIKAKQQQLASYSSSGSYVARSDQQFRTSFQNLSQDVSNLTALMPHPPNAERVARSDPNGYLMRHLEQLDRSWPRFVQSVCWTVLHEGFFALPLGFGALGRQGEGGEKLGQLQRLFEKHIEGECTIRC
jgi:chromosome segregation ATPase